MVILLLIGLTTCTKDSFLRLEVNGATANFFPDYTNSKSFASNSGDTISISLVDQTTYFESINPGIGNRGSLPDYDRVEIERRRLTIGSDTPFIRVSYSLDAAYSPNSITQTQDVLTVNYQDEGLTGLSLDFNYLDSLQCLSDRCSFDDTITLLSRTFNNVYFTRRDSVSLGALYISSANGLIGFKTSGNEIFELIQ